MANKLPLLGDDFEIWGHWWLPGDPDNKVAGRLTSKFGALELKLLHPFPAIDPHDRDAVAPVVYGVGDTKLFTLWDAFQIGCSIQAPGTTQPIFRHMRVLVGEHIEARKDMLFTGLILSGANIGPWSGIQGVDYQLTFRENDSPSMEYRLSENRSKELLLQDPRMKINIGAGFETINKEFQSYGFNVFPSIHVKFDDEINFDKVRNYWKRLSDFLSLTIGKEFITERITLKTNGGKRPDDSLELRVDHPPPEESKVLNAWEVLVPLAELADNAPRVFEQWFSKSGEVRDSIDLLIGNMRRRELPIHVQLNTLCQALESFHRTTAGGGYLSKNDYKPVARSLTDAIPEETDAELKRAIKDRVRYAYEYSLRTRLTQLLGQIELESLEKLGIMVNDFANAVCKARNDFTHWDTGDESKDDTNLLNLVSKLKMIVRIVLLKHFGIDEKTVVRRALENKALYFQEWRNISVDEEP